MFFSDITTSEIKFKKPQKCVPIIFISFEAARDILIVEKYIHLNANPPK